MDDIKIAEWVMSKKNNKDLFGGGRNIKKRLSYI